MPYAELHVKTNFSFLEGASHPEELVQRAAELELAALAITDGNTLAGIVRAHVAAKQAGVKLIVGAELAPIDAPPVVLWAMNRQGYGQLCRLITRGRRRSEKGRCHLLFADLAEHAQGLLAGVVLSYRSPALLSLQAPHQLPCSPRAPGADSLEDRQLASPPAAPRLIPPPRVEAAPAERFADAASLRCFRELFGDRCYALVELHRGADDQRRLRQLVAIAREAGLPPLAAGGVHYHVPQRQALQDVLTAIRHGCTVEEAGGRLFANAERHLKSPREMEQLFAAAPDCVGRTLEAAQRCTFSLDELRYEYPEELAPPGETPISYLRRLTWEGAAHRYPQGVPEKIRSLLEHELKLIEDLRYEAYFLTVWDLVRFARGRGILCQGRGSAANSAVCYCLGITSVDPDRIDVLFERFVSRERNEAPDIDVDFEHERREEVLQYLYNKYGRERAGMTAEVITYGSRLAVRDVGKALGLSLDRVDAISKSLDGRTHDPALAQRCQDAGVGPDSLAGSQLIELAQELTGFPRHLSQHVGGMVITRGPLCELVPIENAAMDGRTVIQWNKDDLDELGILKVDCLALGMLTAIRKAFALVEKHWGRRLSLADIPEGDQRVYDMICAADTMGVFQIESRAQMSMLPRLRPRCYYDLVVEVAIVRPGPIQGNMVHPYLRRRAGLEPVVYPHPAVQQVLEKTLGVPIFQEQAMRLAVVAAGFTAGEADQLRRAMAAWRRPGVIDQFREKLIQGMLAHGIRQEFAQQVFQQIQGFGEYGFPESHAASFALLVYVSAWLKRYYPAAFAAALINSQPMGFYAPAQLVRDAREHGVEIRPVDVNASCWDCTLEGAPRGGEPAPRDCALRLGLRLVSGLSETHARAVEQARRRGRFFSVDDFARRTRLPRAVVSKLAAADAFASLALPRRQALWQALATERGTKRAGRGTRHDRTPRGAPGSNEEQGGGPFCDPRNAPHEAPLFAQLPPEPDDDTPLPPMAEFDEVRADYAALGLTLRRHPIAFVRGDLDALGVAPAGKLTELPNHAQVRVAGLVLLRQRPSTARGITFVTIEDETGTANLLIHIQTWQRYYRVARTAAAVIAHGRLQREGQVIHVIVSRLEDLSARLRTLQPKSRDFR